MSTKNCENCEHEDKREPFNYGDCEECKRFHIDADETFKDMWQPKVTNDVYKEFEEVMLKEVCSMICSDTQNLVECKTCKATHYAIWSTCAEMMSGKVEELEKDKYQCIQELLGATATVLEQKDKINNANKVIQEQQERIEKLKKGIKEIELISTIPDSEFNVVVKLKEKYRKQNQDLQQKLDKAVEIIDYFTENGVPYDDRLENEYDIKLKQAEQFIKDIKE